MPHTEDKATHQSQPWTPDTSHYLIEQLPYYHAHYAYYRDGWQPRANLPIGYRFLSG